MTGLDGRAIGMGVLVDILGSIVFGSLLLVLVSNASGAATDEEMTALFRTSPAVQLASLAIGTFFVAAGGFAAGRLAKERPLEQALVVGAVDVAYGFVTAFGAPDVVPFWLEATGLLIAVPAAIAGAYLVRFFPKAAAKK